MTMPFVRRLYLQKYQTTKVGDHKFTAPEAGWYAIANRGREIWIEQLASKEGRPVKITRLEATIRVTRPVENSDVSVDYNPADEEN
jgi:hypothetical protein